MSTTELSTEVVEAGVEGGASVPIKVLLSAAAPVGGLPVNFAWQGSAAVTDYTVAAGTGITALTTSSFTIAAGVTQALLMVTPAVDSLVEPTETLRLSLQAGSGYTIAASAFKFASPVSLATAASDPHVVVGDFNGDRLLDIVGVNEDAKKVTWLKANGDGSFAAGVQVAVSGTPADATAGDFDRDGITDLAVTLANTNQVVVALDPTRLGTWTAYSVGIAPRYSTMGDFNADGIPDLAVTNLGKTISVLLGKGNGTFNAASSYETGDSPHQPAAIDVNRDGKQDLVLADYASGKVLVHLANAAQPGTRWDRIPRD
jgi:hypothetical protein